MKYNSSWGKYFVALKLRRSWLHCKDAAQETNKQTSVEGEDFLCQLTHNSGPLHRVIRAGAARRSINASLMPRRTNCKPTIQHDERGRGRVGGVRETGGRRREMTGEGRQEMIWKWVWERKRERQREQWRDKTKTARPRVDGLAEGGVPNQTEEEEGTGYRRAC